MENRHLDMRRMKYRYHSEVVMSNGATPAGNLTPSACLLSFYQTVDSNLFFMTLTLKNRSTLSVPAEVQRRAGIKPGDRLEFKVSSGIITITLKDPVAYKPTKSELAAIRKGEAAIARGQSVSLTDFLHGLDSQRRKTGTKASRKTSR